MRRVILAIAAMLVLTMSQPIAAQTIAAQTNVLFIVDFSGSMNEKVDDRTKIAVAKEVFRDTAKAIPPTVNVGLLVYGHRTPKSCGDIEVISRLGQQRPLNLADQVDRLQARGETPIATALVKGAMEFDSHKGERNLIVLITDGREECNGNPCEAATLIARSGVEVAVDVIGFKLSAADRQAVECISKNTGGRYYDASDVRALKAAFAEVGTQVAQSQPAPQPPGPEAAAEINLLSPSNGGQLLAAPRAEWEKIISGKDEETVQLGLDVKGLFAIFAFQDERPATFSSFSILIPSMGSWTNEFELAVADELSGPYRSLGKFKTQNLRLLRTPYQEFKFPEATAKYLKFIMLSRHGDAAGSFPYLSQIRLMGKVRTGG